MKKILLGVLLLCSIIFSQKTDSVKSRDWKTFYRASATKINDLVNTKLDVQFRFFQIVDVWESMDHSSSSFLSY